MDTKQEQECGGIKRAEMLTQPRKVKASSAYQVRGSWLLITVVTKSNESVMKLKIN